MNRKTNREKPQPASLRAQALRLLARREHTRLELERKLAPRAGDAAELAALLDEFTRCGWLSELRLAEQFAHARRGKFGSSRIRRELLERGVSEESLAGVMPELAAGDLEAARAVWQRKFGVSARDRAERARQVRFMQGRGFALDTIMKVIRSERGDDENA